MENAPDLTRVTFEGGDGKSMETPIVIRNAENVRNGIASEYAYMAKLHGEKFRDWKPVGQSSTTRNGRTIDSVGILILSTNETIVYFFDITDFYGKP